MYNKKVKNVGKNCFRKLFISIVKKSKARNGYQKGNLGKLEIMIEKF